jgi:hypothetical protein
LRRALQHKEMEAAREREKSAASSRWEFLRTPRLSFFMWSVVYVSMVELVGSVFYCPHRYLNSLVWWRPRECGYKGCRSIS